MSNIQVPAGCASLRGAEEEDDAGRDARGESHAVCDPERGLEVPAAVLEVLEIGAAVAGRAPIGVVGEVHGRCGEPVTGSRR
jgi:hypothetical protein